MGYKSDRRLYLTADGRVVEADDPDRLTLLVSEGGTLSPEDAAKYGLGKEAKPADAGRGGAKGRV